MALGRNQSDRFVLGVALVAAAAAMSAVNASAVQAQDSGRERARLEAVLEELNSGNVSLEELEAIPSAAQSSELRYILQDRAQAQSEVREIQDLQFRIASIETVAIPRVVQGLIADLPAGNAEDGARLEAVLEELNSGNVSLEELEAIPSAAQSSELRYILQDRAQAQSEFREDSQIEDLLSRIESIETVAIPTVIRGLIANLSAADGARD
ncbi:MAG: hypothetical protein OEO79_18080 [Gemmatimonadota bacterium]|nr:hypothetical protein [Gemmatimonadota bacterium]